MTIPPFRCALWQGGALLLLGAIVGGGAPAPARPGGSGGGRCAALAGLALPASAMTLPSGGLRVTSAETRQATADGSVTGFCLVTGTVTMRDPADPPIRFEVNLPTRWNGKAIQFGGAGFNGVVVTGLGQAPHVAADVPVPLAQGYVTYGGDSGHAGTGFDGRFALNAQALANYSGESVKRTHDAAFALVERYYGRKPRRSYHVGGSKGGHEGLVAAERYAADYDGIVAYYPASQNQAMALSWFTMWQAAYGRPGAALSPARQALLKKAVLAACDGLDGAVDGIVADTAGCRSVFAVDALRCPGGGGGEDCLSDPQIDALQAAATPRLFPFPLANGVISTGPYPVYLGGDIAGTLFDPGGLDGGATGYAKFSEQVIPFFDAQDPKFRVGGFAIRDHQRRVQQISAMYDASNPDLDAFHRRGGKLIVVQGTTDMLVAEPVTTAFIQRVRRRYGGQAANFLRYYVQPGFGHAHGDFQMTWDSLAALDRWVESGRPPAAPVAVDAAAPTRGRSLPLCEHPRFPRYHGRGDVRVATSYDCAISDGPEE